MGLYSRSRSLFGIGPMELLVIAGIVLVFVGPQRLPEMMRHVGKFFVHARRYSSDIRGEFNEVVRKAEAEIRMEEAQKLRTQIQEEINQTKQQIEGTIASEAEVQDHHHDDHHHHHDDHHAPSESVPSSGTDQSHDLGNCTGNSLDGDKTTDANHEPLKEPKGS